MLKPFEPFDLDTMLSSATKAWTLLQALANRDRLMLLCQMTYGEFCVS